MTEPLVLHSGSRVVIAAGSEAAYVIAGRHYQPSRAGVFALSLEDGDEGIRYLDAAGRDVLVPG